MWVSGCISSLALGFSPFIRTWGLWSGDPMSGSEYVLTMSSLRPLNYVSNTLARSMYPVRIYYMNYFKAYIKYTIWAHGALKNIPQRTPKALFEGRLQNFRVRASRGVNSKLLRFRNLGF